MERDLELVQKGVDSDPLDVRENIIIFIYEFIGTFIFMSSIMLSVSHSVIRCLLFRTL